nr:tetratricopeptide repeat protein [Metabacillus lacus]
MLDDWETAEIEAFRAAGIFSKDPDLLVVQGRIFSRNGRLNEGITAVRTAALLRPDDIQSKVLLARFLVEGKKYDEALALCGEILELQPKHPDTLNYYGKALYGKGRLQDARVQFQNLQALAPHDAEAIIFLAKINKQLLKDSSVSGRTRKKIKQELGYHSVAIIISTFLINQLRVWVFFSIILHNLGWQLIRNTAESQNMGVLELIGKSILGLFYRGFSLSYSTIFSTFGYLAMSLFFLFLIVRYWFRILRPFR